MILYNVNGFYNRMLEFIHSLDAEGFIKPAHTAMLQVVDNPDALLKAVQQYQAPADKW